MGFSAHRPQLQNSNPNPLQHRAAILLSFFLQDENPALIFDLILLRSLVLMMMCENGMEKDAPHTDTLAMQVWGFFFKAELSTKQIAVEPHTPVSRNRS